MTVQKLPKQIVDLLLPIGWIVPLVAMCHPLPFFLLAVGVWSTIEEGDFLGLLQVIITCVTMVFTFGLIFWVPTMVIAFGVFAVLFRRARRLGKLPHYLIFALLASVCGFVAQAGIFLVTDYSGSLASGDWEESLSIIFYSFVTALPSGILGGWLLKRSVKNGLLLS